jgi:hypothetical protein
MKNGKKTGRKRKKERPADLAFTWSPDPIFNAPSPCFDIPTPTFNVPMPTFNTAKE